MKQPMFWGLVYEFGIYSAVGVATFFIARFLLGFALEGEAVQIVAALLGVAGMFVTSDLFKWMEEDSK
jgi:uncharacterized membrane protein YuzA (DUF378 family)